jgi:hypothetical protein
VLSLGLKYFFNMTVDGILQGVFSMNDLVCMRNHYLLPIKAMCNKGYVEDSSSSNSSLIGAIIIHFH